MPHGQKSDPDADEAEPLVSNCPAGHPLSILTAYDDERQCDVCGGMICEGDSFGACEECGYDNCESCIHDKQQQGWSCKISKRTIMVKMMLTLSSFIVLLAGMSTTAASIHSMEKTTRELAYVLRERESFSVESTLESKLVQPLYASNILFHKTLQNNISLDHSTGRSLDRMSDLASKFRRDNILLFAVNVTAETIAAVGFDPEYRYDNVSFKNKGWSLIHQPFTELALHWGTPTQVNWTSLFTFPPISRQVGPGIACVRVIIDKAVVGIVGAYYPIRGIEDHLHNRAASPGSNTVLLGTTSLSSDALPVSVSYEVTTICDNCKGSVFPPGCSLVRQQCTFSEVGLLTGTSLRSPVISQNGTRMFPHQSTNNFIRSTGGTILELFGTYEQLETEVISKNAVGDFLSFVVSDDSGDHFVDAHIVDIHGKRFIVLYSVQHSTAFATYNSKRFSITILATWVVLSSYLCSVLINLTAVRPMAEVKVLLTHRIRKVRAAYAELNTNLIEWGKKQARAADEFG